MKTITNQIKECIEKKLDAGYKEFIIYPFGDVGIQVKQILNNVYGIQESYILDNHLYKYNPQIKNLVFCTKLDCHKYCIILSCTNMDIYQDLKLDISKYFEEKNLAELEFCKIPRGGY